MQYIDNKRDAVNADAIVSTLLNRMGGRRT